MLLPFAGLFSSIALGCPVGIAYQNCSGCHVGGSYNYGASWSSIPTVMERNSTDTVTFSMNRISGSAAADGGFSAQTSLGSFTATAGETIISGSATHSAPDPTEPFSWSFTFNSGPASGTANLDAYGNPVDGNRTATSNANPLCDGGANGTTGTSGDGNSGGTFPQASTSIVINDRPVISAGGGSAGFTEGGSAVTVAPLLTLTDTENSSTEIQSGSVTITTNYNAGDGDALNINTSVCTANSLICAGSGTRTITITGGNESAAEFRNVLRAITFSNTSLHPSTLTRSVQFSVTDQYNRVRSSTRNVTVAGVESPASFDSPVYNLIGTGTSSSTTQAAAEDNLIQLQFFATDPESVATNFTLVSTTPALTAPEPLISVTSGGLLSWTPDGNRTSVTAVIGVNDNVGGSPDDTFSITFNVVLANDAPVISEGTSITVSMTEDLPGTFSLTLNATDIDLPPDTLTWSVDAPAGSNGAAATAGDGLGNSEAISYTPNLNLEGNSADSFTVRVSDGSLFDTIDVIVDITPVNDSPVISPVGAQNGIEGQLVTITPVAVDPDDLNDGTQLTWTFVSGQQPGMTISNQGQVNWTPPLGPPAVFNQMYPITIRVQDGLEDGAVPDDESFMLVINPPDSEVLPDLPDGVADYDDFCPSFNDPTNSDNDNDGVAGTDGGANTGGDVCDLDDDNDGMPDTYEIANSLNPLVNDAALDNDGDSVSNFQEFLDGTNPNQPNLVIDATGYWTPFVLPQPDPTSIHLFATRVTANDYGPYRPGINDITWTPSNAGDPDLASNDPANLVSNPPIQTFRIRPLLNFAASQQVEEGSVGVTVELMLNGEAPAYPVTVGYTIGGTATAGVDYSTPTPLSGSVVFNDTTPATISFDVVGGDGADPGETIVFTLDAATTSNAAIGAASTHRVTIVEGNVAPAVGLQFRQAGGVAASTYTGDGNIQIDAVVSDVNAGQNHSYDWSGTDNALLPPGNLQSWTIAAPAAGNYLVDVIVTDDGVPARSTRISRILNVTAGNAPSGGDDDDDGIPNALDPFDSSVATGSPNNLNLIPDQTADPGSSHIIQTDPGLKLSTGNTAQAANQFGVLLTDNEIAQFGSVGGGAPLNATDVYEHFGGVYEFTVSGLLPGTSANVVIPLRTPVPRNAVYRKFDPATGWGDFTVNGQNRVASAAGDAGACPEPGSGAYRAGLAYLHNCIQLTVQDGGANDADGLVNGVISDPGTIGIQLTEPSSEEVEEGSSRMSPHLLLSFLLLTIFALRRRELRRY